jgi:hypothetical protein
MARCRAIHLESIMTSSITNNQRTLVKRAATTGADDGKAEIKPRIRGSIESPGYEGALKKRGRSTKEAETDASAAPRKPRTLLIRAKAGTKTSKLRANYGASTASPMGKTVKSGLVRRPGDDAKAAIAKQLDALELSDVDIAPPSLVLP